MRYIYRKVITRTLVMICILKLHAFPVMGDDSALRHFLAYLFTACMASELDTDLHVSNTARHLQPDRKLAGLSRFTFSPLHHWNRAPPLAALTNSLEIAEVQLEKRSWLRSSLADRTSSPFPFRPRQRRAVPGPQRWSTAHRRASTWSVIVQIPDAQNLCTI